MLIPACQVAAEQMQQVLSDAQLFELGHQASMPYTVEGSSNVQGNHQGGTAGI